MSTQGASHFCGRPTGFIPVDAKILFVEQRANGHSVRNQSKNRTPFYPCSGSALRSILCPCLLDRSCSPPG